MKIERVTIHNFRSIVDASFMMQDYTLVIGANNAGKSSVIDAIRCFYEADKESKFNSDRDFPKCGAVDKESWVEITYKLTTEENNSLKEEYQSNNLQLTLRKYLYAEKARMGTIFFKDKNGNISTSAFYGAKNVQDGKIGDLIYIPALSKVEDQTKLSGPSVLRDLISKIFESVVEGSEPYGNLVAQVNKFSQDISDLETEDHRSIRGFEKGFNESITDWGTEFALDIKTPTVSEMVKNMVSWHLKDIALNSEHPIERYGSGFQRHFIYSLIRLSAEFLPHKKKGKIKDFTPDFTLLLFEEPEVFLHPQQQDVMARSLRKIAKNDSWQVLCSSHSPHFVSHNIDDLKSIVRLQKKEKISTIHQISDADLNAMLKVPPFDTNKYPVLASKYNSVADPDIESIKFIISLNPFRAGVFFADKALLVEGTTEQVFINRLIEDEKVGVSSGVFVLDCIGKFNIFRFMYLLDALGISHSVIHDEDSPANAAQKEWNALILASKTQLTDVIEQLSPDLEGYLGVETPTNQSSKPQALLAKYERGEIDQLSLQKFAGIVAKCLGTF